MDGSRSELPGSANHHEVVQRRRIRNDHRHGLDSDSVMSLAIAFEVLDRVLELDAVLLEESINFEARFEPKQTAELGRRKLALPVGLEGNRFERGARSKGGG